MTTLIQIIQSVARQIPVDVPTVAVGSTDQNAATLLSAALWSARRVFREHDWRALTKEYTWTTTPSVAAYALPSDYHRLAMETAWDRTEFKRLQGALSPQEWQLLKSGSLTISLTVSNFRIKPVAGIQKFTLDPTPTAAHDLVFEYVSANWALSAGGGEIPTWAADGDSPILDPEIIELGTLARALRRLGMDYQEEQEEFEERLRKAAAEDGGGQKTLSLLPRTFGPTFLGYHNVPDTGYGQ